MHILSEVQEINLAQVDLQLDWIGLGSAVSVERLDWDDCVVIECHLVDWVQVFREFNFCLHWIVHHDQSSTDGLYSI